MKKFIVILVFLTLGISAGAQYINGLPQISVPDGDLCAVHLAATEVDGSTFGSSETPDMEYLMKISDYNYLLARNNMALKTTLIGFGVMSAGLAGELMTSISADRGDFNYSAPLWSIIICGGAITELVGLLSFCSTTIKLNNIRLDLVAGGFRVAF